VKTEDRSKWWYVPWTVRNFVIWLVLSLVLWQAAQWWPWIKIPVTIAVVMAIVYGTYILVQHGRRAKA
jgi:hypothetical protein